MIIGFTQRTQTVSESMALPGEESFPLPIHVATLRTAEREYSMIFRLQVSSSSANVEPIGEVVNQLYDATFGTRDNIGERIEVFFFLEALEDTVFPLRTFIRNDLRPEYEECFTIRIHPRDVHSHHVFNPRRACARVLVCLCICLCLSVCSRSSCFSVRWNQQTTVLTGFS